MISRLLSAVLARLIGLCIVPMVLIALWLAWRDLRAQEAQHLREAQQFARNATSGIDHLLEERIKALSMLASSPLADDQSRWPELYGEARNFLANFQSHVIFADEHRRSMFSTRAPYGATLPRVASPRGRSASRLALQSGRAQVGDLVIGPTIGRPVVAIAVPVLRDSAPPRLMVSAIEARWLQEYVDRLDLPRGWAMTLQDGTGAEIARRAPPGFDGRRDVDDDHRITARLALSPWSVVLEMPRTLDQAQRRETLLPLATAILLALLIALGGGLWASRRMREEVAMLGAPAGHAPQPLEIAEFQAAGRRIVEASARAAASDDRLRLWAAAFQQVEVGLAISDARKGVLVSVNPAFARDRGFTIDELAGQPVSGLFPADRHAELRELLAEADRSGHVSAEIEHLRRDGSRFPVLLDLTVVRDPAGRPLNRLALVLDITERKRLEQERTARQAAELERQRHARVAALNLMDDEQAARREVEAAADELRKLSQAVEQSDESIEITNLDARITYVNSAFLQHSGYSRDEVIGRNSRLLQSGQTPRETYRALWDALGRGATWRGEFINRRKDGSVYVELATITPLRRPDGQVTHYVAVKEDVTERKRIAAELDNYRHHLEQLVAARTGELEQSQRQAESANRAKTAFLANMSHEIRTPMNAILGFTHLLRRDARSSVEVQRLDKIESAGTHLLGVINDILDLSKIEAGKLELEMHDFTLEAVLGHVATLIGERSAAKGLELRVEGDDGEAWVRGDLTRLRQALLNLASNAVKFTERGSIVLRARLVESPHEGYLARFEVEDTGVGIAPDVLRGLFQAFQQGDGSNLHSVGGTGLGLAITRQLARAMGGEAGADSTPGVGSLFWFTARLEHGSTSSLAPAGLGAADLQRRHAGKRVLVVEDHPINLEVATDLLQAAGLAVATAENGAQALERVRDGRFDVILMDMVMPGMDGLEATRALRQIPEARSVPIIAMTANAFVDDRRACLAAGMNDFVAKPVDPQHLYATLDRWLVASGDAEATPPAEPTQATQPTQAMADGSTSRRAPNGPSGYGTSVIMARLSQEAGVDLARGLAAMKGEHGQLIELLRLMATTHRNDMRELQECLQRGAREDARRIAHRLAGVATTLGATVLFGAVRALENRLREPAASSTDDLDALIGAADLQLLRLLEIVGDARVAERAQAGAAEPA